MNKKYDYIILGAGASGLMLAYRMSQESYFDDKVILIIDHKKEKGNDRTWCYWEKGEGEWDHLLTKSWPKVFFGSESFSKTITIAPFSYKMIRSEQLYQKFWEIISLKSNFCFVEDRIKNFVEFDKGVKVVSNNTNYFGFKLINSIPNKKSYEIQKKYPVLQQHFIGWFVKTKTDCFDDSVVNFMDFKIPQKGNTRFMYVLPINKNTALFEYTLFSKSLLKKSEYESAIMSYLEQKQITDFEILEKEIGSIPMTSFKFEKLNSENILNIGTAGGWTKSSTGYTFNNSSKKTKDLISFLKTENDFTRFSKRTKFWIYDLLFLDVLASNNSKGSTVFSCMFKKVNIKTIFKFLDEESTFFEDLQIISSVPIKLFISAIFKRIFKT